MTEHTTLGELIRTLRTARGWSTRKLAGFVGIDASQISNIETSTRPNPTLRTVMGLARALGVKPILLVQAFEFPGIERIPEPVDVQIQRTVEEVLRRVRFLTPDLNEPTNSDGDLSSGPAGEREAVIGEIGAVVDERAGAIGRRSRSRKPHQPEAHRGTRAARGR